MHKRHGGLWEFPGGKCEPGESDRQAISRELKEELGVQVVDTGAELFAIDDPESPFRLAFVLVSFAGEPSCHEHMALTWAKVDELAHLPLAPGDRRFIESLTGREITYVLR
jgi:8-oxo-dGTP diphosphatase